ncbi:D-glycero-beta-D-manno-heptose-1,7-bisphosphate 7-phosphatase [hydrothermal vent metagenome]|uniref:D,D-heptose 1,7-bisphosphate phosphatase n=1 Tax=hydrothermal vent metagenome TaxID=652676 RepID=A0A3B0QNE8_9ZZZZ
MVATRAVVYLDRDGTINHDPGYLSNPDDVVLLEGAAKAIKTLNDSGIKAIVISNQSAIGRGYFTERELFAVNARVSEIIKDGGGALDAIYYCPHRPDAGCGCRKPRTGLIEQAAAEHHLEGLPAYFVGDKVSDMGAARGAGAKAVMVLTGYGSEELKKLDSQPDFVARDLTVAVSWIINDLDGEGKGCGT